MKKKKLLAKWLESFLLLTCILTSAYAQLTNVTNVALNKPTVQGPYNRTEDGGGGSQLAVNGNTRQDGGFAHSVDNSNRGPPWLTYWQVDLQQRYNISRISIWFALLDDKDRTMKRQRGYSLEVSDTPFSLSEGPRGQLCYHDNGEQTEPLSTATFDNCSFTGRYVILYNRRPLKYDPRYSLHPNLQLTEVEVLVRQTCDHCVDPNDPTTGCQEGWFPASDPSPCSSECPEACKTCEAIDDCSDCKEGFSLVDKLCCPENCSACAANGSCSSCKTGFHGSTCGLKCSANCISPACDQSTGSCNCTLGFYGSTCNTSCPSNCGSSGCSETGKCFSCLNDSWQGETCGASCHSNCEGGTCHQNGTCKTGCKAGTHGDDCSDTCSLFCVKALGCERNGSCIQCDGDRWGPTCEEECNANCMGGCKRNGSCIQCQDGYYGPTCTAECNANCKGGCEKDDGTCQECTDGFHGNRCQDPCSDTCKPSNGVKACDKDSGRCLNGCIVRHYGDTCQSNCPLGCKRCDSETYCSVCDDNRSWGDICEKPCSSQCDNKECNRNGVCDRCVAGYYGPDCNTVCSSNCEGSVCERSGTCTLGCAAGYYGDQCNQECWKTITDCQQCSRDGQKCLACQSAKFGEQCDMTCPAHCLECRSAVNCSRCEPGYTGDVCDQVCPVGCKECDSQVRCLQCEDGKFGDNCQYNCSSDCLSCKATVSGGDQFECLSCPSGKYLDRKRCVQCRANCELCSERYRCSECKDGFYGSYCQRSCPTQCVACLSDTDCTACKPGWSGERCHCSNNCTQTGNEWCRSDGFCTKGCIPGTYGAKCSKSCTDQNCERCDQSTGSCEQCKPGYWYGDNSVTCQARCGHCLAEKDGQSLCDIITGKCSPCKNGWYGPNCEQECNPNCKAVSGSVVECNKDTGGCTLCHNGFYGAACEHQCNHFCRDRFGQWACSKMDGACNSCAEGFYGTHCELNCSLNCAGGCDKSSGVCVDCVGGYYGKDNCDMKCPLNCGGQSSNGVICNRFNGECLYCRFGFHGERCEQNCSKGCGGKNWEPPSCDKANGRCSSCQDGYYGDYCEEPCSTNCQSEEAGKLGKCDRVSGSCTEGCRDGWYNETCQSNCSRNCLEGRCDQQDGMCTVGCVSGFTGDGCQEEQKQVEKAGSSTVIIVAVVVVALVLALVVLGVILYRKRQGRAGYVKASRQELPLHALRNGVEAQGNSALYANVNGKSANQLPLPARQDRGGADDDMDDDEMTPLVNPNAGDASDYYNLSTRIPVDSFVTYVQGKKAENKDWYKEDFQKLPKGLLKNCRAAVSAPNKGKCRYKNIYPYDDNRVLLELEDNDPNSDFVNGSYVQGYKKPEAFIAAQGPTDVNLKDFWRMIWQKDCGKVVMLTNLFEELKMKCVRYWPELESTESYGNIEVTNSKEDVFPDYIVRHLQVSQKGSGEEKTINQYHFTSWPDRGVPANPGCILLFRDRVMEPDNVPDGPILVHCSAGIGRTGTFIVVDYLINQAKAESHLDVFRCVTDMRYQRTNFVQTDVQYDFIHNTLVEAMTTKDTEVQSSDFCRYYWDLQTPDEDTGKTKLQEQFEMLAEISPVLDQDNFQSGAEPDNVAKNRYKDITPVDSFRAYLSTPVKGCNEYVNAVFVPSFTNKYAYLMTQMPLPNTVIDFWRLVYDQRCTAIVMMNELTDNDETVGEYWPSDDTTYGPFKVELQSFENHDSFSIMTMKLTYTSFSKTDTMTVKQFRFEGWSESDSLPLSSLHLTRLIHAVSQDNRQARPTPVIVHCMNGVERSGLFCVMAAVLEELQNTDKVNIIQTILQLRSRRPQIIGSLEQFDFCHKTVAEHLESNQIYSNLM